MLDQTVKVLNLKVQDHTGAIFEIHMIIQAVFWHYFIESPSYLYFLKVCMGESAVVGG